MCWVGKLSELDVEVNKFVRYGAARKKQLILSYDAYSNLTNVGRFEYDISLEQRT